MGEDKGCEGRGLKRERGTAAGRRCRWGHTPTNGAEKSRAASRAREPRANPQKGNLVCCGGWLARHVAGPADPLGPPLNEGGLETETSGTHTPKNPSAIAPATTVFGSRHPNDAFFFCCTQPCPDRVIGIYSIPYPSIPLLYIFKPSAPKSLSRAPCPSPQTRAL